MLAQAISHKQWTRDECVALERAGIIDPQRYELIEGELIQRMGKNQPHVRTLALLCAWLRSAFGDLFISQESPIDVSPGDNPTSEPEPDAIVLDKTIQAFVNKPRPENVRLVAEVSDSSLFFDLNVKANLYARARIQEYWVVDINARRLIIHRDPMDGRYQTITPHASTETVSPLAAPAAQLQIASIF